MVLAINNGVCDEALASEKPGPVNAARWLTIGSRFLRNYVTKENPSPILRKIVEFIVKVYAPFWFLVKNQPLAIHGSRHVFKYICWLCELPEDVQMIVRPSIEYNSYYFHPENVLLAMITDPDPAVRSEAYEKISEARGNPPASLRVFRVPKNRIIKFDATSYTQMIDWNLLKITEPPCLQFYWDDQLVASIDSVTPIEIPGKYIFRDRKIS